MKNGRAESVAEQTKPDQQEHGAAQDESAGVAAIDKEQPGREGRRQQDQIVLDEEGDGQKQRSDDIVARRPRRAQRNQQPSDRDGVSEQLRIVHADIVAGKQRHATKNRPANAASPCCSPLLRSSFANPKRHDAEGEQRDQPARR